MQQIETDPAYEEYFNDDDGKLFCYQCDQETKYLFPDARCLECTRIVPGELIGNL